jgi:hypothetical protein
MENRFGVKGSLCNSRRVSLMKIGEADPKMLTG